MDFAAQVLSVLRVNGRVPRRAVLLPGGGALADRASHPEQPELELLSRLCEIARHAAGQPVYPRRTADLLEVALGSNAPGAWEAAKDDIVTGDLDLEAATAYIRCGSNSAALVACLVGARDSNHMVHVCLVLSRVLGRLSEEARAEMGRALACQLRAVMDSFVSHGAFLGRDVRDAIFGGFGRLVAAAGVPASRVAELVLYALAQKRDELLRLFLHVPPTFLVHRPQILAELLDRAKAAPAQSRYPLVALLARVVATQPDIVHGLEPELAEVVCGALPDAELDSRACLAAAALATAASGCGTPVAAALARALQSCAGALVIAAEHDSQNAQNAQNAQNFSL